MKRRDLIKRLEKMGCLLIRHGDRLVSFSSTPSLLEFVRLKNHLSEILGLEVDLVMRDALKPHIGEKIIDEAVSI